MDLGIIIITIFMHYSDFASKRRRITRFDYFKEELSWFIAVGKFSA